MVFVVESQRVHRLRATQSSRRLLFRALVLDWKAIGFPAIRLRARRNRGGGGVVWFGLFDG